MKDSQILKAVRKLIKTHQHKYICYALNEVSGPMDQKEALKRWVTHMLGGSDSATYWIWLKDNHPEFSENLDYDSVREGRLQWLDWMIAECEKAEAIEMSSYLKACQVMDA